VYGVQTRPHKLIALNITGYKQNDLFIYDDDDDDDDDYDDDYDDDDLIIIRDLLRPRSLFLLYFSS
jgi:hypothetical protein